MDYETGKSFVLNKLKRSYAKLSEESRKFYCGKYERAMEIIGENKTINI